MVHVTRFHIMFFAGVNEQYSYCEVCHVLAGENARPRHVTRILYPLPLAHSRPHRAMK